MQLWQMNWVKILMSAPPHHLILEMDVAAFRIPELTERLLEMQTLAEAIDMVMMEKLERDLLGGE